MIKTAQSQSEIQLALTTDFIVDKQPLRDYAGFEPGSVCEGRARQSFSLVLSAVTITHIHETIKILYDQLLAACWPENTILPFDMVRFDAFVDPSSNELKIIELNTRNVGLHEIVEWLDDKTAAALNVVPQWSLNKHFVANQKLLHTSQLGDNPPLLYMTKPMIPAWKYHDELVAAYSSVRHVTDLTEYDVTPIGLSLNGTIYKAIARKFSWATETDTEKLNTDGVISIMQPLWMRPFGHKDYLPKFDSPAILKSDIFDSEDIDEYEAKKDELVLKIINAGGSKSVYLGATCSNEQWRDYLRVAAQNPELWILQQYCKPHAHEVIMHGQGSKRLPIQLGIFVLPKPSAPHECSIDMVVKGYAGTDDHFTFDPSGLNPDIWFGNVIELQS